MDEKDVVKKLEQTDPPQIELKDARARLRRELLTSPEFEARTAAPRRVPGWRLAFAGLVAITAVAILAIQFVPRRSSAEALIAAMGSAYDASFLPDAIHYVKQGLKLNGDRSVVIESWLFSSEHRFRVRIKDARTAETLGHTISADGRTYDLPESRMHVLGGVSEPMPEAEGHSDMAAPGRHERRVMTVVVQRANEGDEWSDETLARAFLISDFFNRNPRISRTPHDLVRELAADGQVAYAGATLDSRSQLEVEILERRNAGALPFVVEFPMKHLDDVQRFFGRVAGWDPHDATLDRCAALLDEQGLGEAIVLRPVEPLERIEVDSATSRIRKLSLSIVEGGKEIYSAETTFLEDRYLPYAPDTFDPDLHGLSAADPGAHFKTLNQE